MSSSDAIRGVQLILRSQGADVRVDGIYGSRTDAALSRSTSSTIRALKGELGLSMAPVASSSGWTFVPQSDLDRGMAAAVAEFGSEVKPFLSLMIQMENKSAPGGVLTRFNQTFKGVGQFGASTWELGTKADKYPQAGPYSNVADASISMRLAAWYYLDNKRIYETFRRQRGLAARYDAKLGYLFHQQGANAAISYLRTGSLMYPDQSAQSIALFRAMRSEVVV